MALDLAGALAEALADPRVGAVLGKLFKPLVAQSLAESSADSWLTAKEAARYLYGTDGKTEAFRKLRNAHPALDRVGVGEGRQRRWKRADIDQYLASSPRAQRRRIEP